jgi:hypothetical protein
VRVLPLYDAEMVADVETRTGELLTVNVAPIAPSGTTTLEGTLAEPLLLPRMILTPPAGAGPLNVTLPVEDSRPPTTLDGLSVSDARATGGGGTGVTVSKAVMVTPL